MRRVTEEELVFYDGVADRINRLLGHRECPLTQSSLAERIGWNRSSLCNFLNRIDKSIAAHFIPQIAQSLGVPLEHLISGTPGSQKNPTSWDPRWDEPELIMSTIAEWKQRKVSWMSLDRDLPAWVMPTRAMLLNYIDSIFDGANPVAAERWHEMKERIAVEGEGECLHIMFMRDLMRIPQRLPPYHGFTTEEIVGLLEHLKNEWVSRRDFLLVAADDSAWTPEVRLEMAGNRSLMVLGRELRIEVRKDFRIQWSDDPKTIGLTRECLAQVKKSSGLKMREGPTRQEMRSVIDELLLHVDTGEGCSDDEEAMAFPAGTHGRFSSSSAALLAASGRGEAMAVGR